MSHDATVAADFDEEVERSLALLPPDHPGVQDRAYRARRNAIAAAARSAGASVPDIEYSEEEHATWRLICGRLAEVHERHAARAYLDWKARLPLPAERVPDLRVLSEALRRCCGFSLRAIPGLIDSRAFLTALGGRVMSSTQYLRHPARPDHTPEPDMVHEVVGHVPLLADPDFAEFSTLLGRAAATAGARQLEWLERLYWFTLEFGLVEDAAGLRAYGAGLLSSFGELPQAFSEGVERRPFRVDEVIETRYDFASLQPLLFVVPSFAHLRREVAGFVASASYARGAGVAGAGEVEGG